MVKDLDTIIDTLTMTEEEFKSFQKADNEDYEWNEMLNLMIPDADSDEEIHLIRKNKKKQ